MVSVALLFHLAAVLAGTLGAVPPFSDLEHAAYMAFKPYYDLIDQGYAYNYYAPEPPPTPVVEATLHFADGRPDATIRIPDRGTGPGCGIRGNWLSPTTCMTISRWPGASRATAARAAGPLVRPAPVRDAPRLSGVTLQVRMHKIPELPRIHEIWESSRRARVDLDAEEFYSEPERIGEYPCAD